MNGTATDQMWQALTRAPGEVVMRRVPVPKVLPGTVGVTVRRIGICGSDLHVFRGQHPYTSYPVVQGHEVAGVVFEVGAGVRGFSIGDQIALKPQLSCGVCTLCTSEREHICSSLRVMGFQAPGAGQEKIVIAPSQAVRIGESMTLDAGALVEPVAVAVHALRQVTRPYRRVLVIGAGPIGNLVAQLAAARGAEVLITDLSAAKLVVAASAGLRTIEASEGLETAARAMFPGGPELVVECVGSEATIAAAIRLAPRGGSVLVVGVFGQPARIDVGLIQDRELHVHGSLMYRREDYDEAIANLSASRIDTSGLITHRFSFQDLPHAYADVIARRDEVIKAMVTV